MNINVYYMHGLYSASAILSEAMF